MIKYSSEKSGGTAVVIGLEKITQGLKLNIGKDEAKQNGEPTFLSFPGKLIIVIPQLFGKEDRICITKDGSDPDMWSLLEGTSPFVRDSGDLLEVLWIK